MKKTIVLLGLGLLLSCCISITKAQAQFTKEFECEYFTDVDGCDTLPMLTVVQVYPNPIVDGEMLYCTAVDEEVCVIDLHGRAVKRFKNRSEIYDLPQGIYFALIRKQIIKIVKL